MEGELGSALRGEALPTAPDSPQSQDSLTMGIPTQQRCAQSGDSILDQRIRREGWSLHQRLKAAAHRDPVPNPTTNPESLDRWRQLVAPDRPANFDKRLRWDDLSVVDALWCLDPPEQQIPPSPPWWPQLEALRQAGRDAAAVGLHRLLADRGQQQPFVHVWRPVAAWALKALQHRCSDLTPRLELREDAWLDLSEVLLERLCNVADQALWELFNRRRTPGQMLLAHLGADGDGTGGPVHEAYDAFVVELHASGYGVLLEAYPVLGRLLAVVTELWLEGSEEMLRRLAQSRAQLADQFAIAEDAPLEAIQQGLSDPHRGGRAVAILRFGQGDEARRVVYKPKDMQLDRSYQRFLLQLNAASILPPLRCLTVLSCDGYGFMEWVEHRCCMGDAELARFYANAGRTMAVLHLLGCTDCHFENLIACGEELLLIDTETLLEGDLRDLISEQGSIPDDRSALQTSLQGSVLHSGLLPHWLMVGAGRKRAFDVSALGVQPPPPEREQPGWVGLNSDGMMASHCLQPCTLPTSLPVGLGSAQRLTDFVEELCGGFMEQLREVIRLRPLLGDSLQQFMDLPRRLVHRPTRLYFTIQRQMLEPAALRTAVDHGLKLEQLSRSYVLAGEKPRNWSMFHAELIQMERLDIPFFEHRINVDVLPLPEGLAPIPGFVATSGLAVAQRRLEQLDAAEIHFQQQLVRGAIAARHLKPLESSQPRLASDLCLAVPEGGPRALEPAVYRQEAAQLAEQLWAAAIQDRNGRPEWLGMDLGGDGESFQFGLIGFPLYSGSSGIALALARMADDRNPSRDMWRQRAWSCLAGLVELAERNSNDALFRFVRDLPYGIAGTGGLLVALQLLQHRGIADAGTLADRLIAQIKPERLLADEGVDVIRGVTGLIGPLLCSGHPRARDLADVCGERLLALQLDNGGWSIDPVRRPLTGFSHGAAGMAAALATLAQATDQQRFQDAARRAVAYERSVYLGEQGNWPDFRTTNKPDQFMLSWCHGAPGILLSRLVLQESGLADGQIEAELEVARATTLSALERWSSSHQPLAAHLCCGVLGLTSLLRVDASLGGLPIAPQVPAAEAALISQAQANGAYTLFSVDSGSIHLPGLFTGKAGVALSLAEVADGIAWLPTLLSAGLLRYLTGHP